MKKVAIILSVIGIIFANSMFLHRDVAAEKSIKDIREEREDIKKDLSDDEKKVADLLIEIEELNSELDELEFILESNRQAMDEVEEEDRKSTRLNSSHVAISYAVFCLKKKSDDERNGLRAQGV